MSRTKAILIALDQLAAAVFFRWPDATLSAWAWVLERRGRRAWPRKAIDWLFRNMPFVWEKDHCYLSYQSEFNRTQFPPDFFNL